MKKQRKHYTPEDKVAILRRHLLNKEPISKLCDELGLQRTVFSAGRRSSSRTGVCIPAEGPGSHSVEQERIAYMEKKFGEL